MISSKSTSSNDETIAAGWTTDEGFRVSLSDATPKPQDEDTSPHPSKSRMPSKKGTKARPGDENWTNFVRATRELSVLAAELHRDVCQGVDPNDRSDLVANIEKAIDDLFNVQFGKDECLARCAVAMESVLIKTEWTRSHVEFVNDAAKFLRTRGYVDDSTVQTIYEIIRSHGLDEFRGVLNP